jgi:hypothetical protein
LLSTELVSKKERDGAVSSWLLVGCSSVCGNVDKRLETASLLDMRQLTAPGSMLKKGEDLAICKNLPFLVTSD